MTWLEGLPTGETDWDRVAQLCPEAFDAMSGLVGAAYEEVDPCLLELCRLRIATLLGYTSELMRRSDRAHASGLTDEKVADLPSWPTSPRFTAADRACLSVTEQFVIDANGVTETHISDVTDHLGPEGCYAFMHALSVLETFQRACLVLGIESAPSVDELAVLGDRQGPSRKVDR